MRTKEEMLKALEVIKEDANMMARDVARTRLEMMFVGDTADDNTKVRLVKRLTENERVLHTMEGVMDAIKWAMGCDGKIAFLLSAREKIMAGEDADVPCDTCTDRADCDIIKKDTPIH